MSFRKNFFLFFLFFCTAAFSQKASLDLIVDDASLKDVFTQIENEYGYLFSYKQEHVKDIKISVIVKNKDIEFVLNEILKETDLEYEIFNENYIVIKRTEARSIGNSAGNKDNLTHFCGVVLDSLTRTPLSYASIYFLKNNSGNYSAGNGKFTFNSEYHKNDTLVVSYVGYQEKRIPASYFIGNDCPSISLSYFNFEEDFIVVKDYLTDGVDLAENGAATVLRPSRIGALPGQVDPDIFSTIQFLPGINAPNGDASGIFVRGGASDQNLILWEGIPIYHAAHFFGMISAFNPFIIDKVKVYRGGFGSSYGGRISSVIELESPEQEPTGTRFGAGLNFVKAYAHGAVGLSEKTTAVFSVRRSISELWRSPTFNNIALRNQQSLLQVGFDVNNIPNDFEINDDFRFWEGHGKLLFNLTEKDNVNVAYFFNDNNFDDLIIDPKKRQEQTDKLDLISNGGSATWKRNWSRNYSMEVLTSFSKYDYDYIYDIRSFGMGQQPDRNGQKQNKVTESQLMWSNEFDLQNHHKLNFGYHFTNYDVDYRILHAKEGSGILEDEQESYDSGVHAAYGEFKSSEKNKFGIDAGIRFSWFQLKDEYYLSPRFKIWYNLTDHINLNFNAGKYRQFISQLVEFKGDNLGFNTPVWVLNGNNEAPVLEATQLQAGILFSKNSWVIDLQAYQKMTKGLTSLAIGFDVDAKKPESGESSSKGLDLLVKKRWKNFRSWISYSLGSATYHFPKFFDPDFPAPFDIRHSFQWAGQIDVNSFEFSLGFNLYSGAPYSFLKDYRMEQGGMGEPRAIPVYDAYNGRYLPMQHHLNASILYNFKTEKTRKKLKGTIGLSLFNIYKQDNIYSREYYIETPKNDPWFIVANNKSGLKMTPNMVVRVFW